MEELKSKVRSKVEHTLGVLKHRFGYRKVRYKGLMKNEAQLYTLFALVNVVKSGEIMRRQGVTKPRKTRFSWVDLPEKGLKKGGIGQKLKFD